MDHAQELSPSVHPLRTHSWMKPQILINSSYLHVSNLKHAEIQEAISITHLLLQQMLPKKFNFGADISKIDSFSSGKGKGVTALNSNTAQQKI